MDCLTDVDYSDLLQELFTDLDKLPLTWESIDHAATSIRDVVEKSYQNLLNYQSSSRRHDENFENSLFESIENVVMAALHEKIFAYICSKKRIEDELIYNKCCEMSAMKVTPDQLGALEDYSIPLPATVVELASLDIHETPNEKLTCLSTAFDLALAELKGAIVDVIALTSDNKIPVLSVSDITPILATIIIHAKPIHLISNLYYVENFHWSKFSSAESECLLAFKTAVDKLKVVSADILLPKSERIYCDIGLEDIIKITNDVDDKYDRKGKRIISPKNPLERHIEHFSNMIAASTLNNVQY